MTGPRNLNLVPLAGAVVGAGCLYGGVVGVPIAGLSTLGQRVLCVFFFALVMWLTKPVPFAISSLATVCVLYLTGIVDTFSAAASGFASRLVFFLILLLLLGNSISKVGLDRHLARRFLIADSPRETIQIAAGSLLVLSFMMPSALARAVAFLPIVDELSDLWNQSEESNFLLNSHLILGHVNPIASMALMTGGGMAILSSEFIRSSVTWLSWLDWAVLMLPPTACVFLLTVVTLLRIHPVSDAAGDVTRDKSVAAGPFDRDQRIVMATMVGVIALWVVGSFVGLPTILPPLLAVFFLALPGVDVVSAGDMREMSWGIIFVFGTMFSLLHLLESTGVLEWVVASANQVLPFSTLPQWQTVALLLAMALVIRLFFSTASAALLVLFPVMLKFASALGLNQLFVSMSLVILVGCSTVFPFNTTTVLFTYDEGPMTLSEVVTTGLITTVYGVAAIVLCWTVYWPLVT